MSSLRAVSNLQAWHRGLIDEAAVAAGAMEASSGAGESASQDSGQDSNTLGPAADQAAISCSSPSGPNSSPFSAQRSHCTRVGQVCLPVPFLSFDSVHRQVQALSSANVQVPFLHAVFLSPCFDISDLEKAHFCLPSFPRRRFCTFRTIQRLIATLGPRGM